MKTVPRIGRRRVLAGLAATLATGAGRTLAAPPLHGDKLGIVAGSLDDQSRLVQQALDAAQRSGATLVLPAGHIIVQNLQFPGAIRVVGTPGATMLIATGADPVGTASLASDLALDGVGFSGGASDVSRDGGLLAIESSAGVRLSNCRFRVGPTSGLLLHDSQVTIEDCLFEALDIAIFSHNSHGLVVRGNTVTDCANGGILIWRDEPGPDGSIVSGNHVSGVRSKAGGNGQNGNGINIYRADGVIVADNVVDGCDFSAVRANSTRNVQIRGNTCTNCQEVAIYSEFAFSGSIISGNIVDVAAAGISITNFDRGGQLAVCAGNIVRNILPRSPTNPDVRPYGIAAEAFTAVTGNTVETVPGIGIAAGSGSYLSNVLVADNVVAGVDIGIAVSVADGTGPVRVAGNMISGTRIGGIVGMKWDAVASADLASDSARYPAVSLEGNVVSP